MEALWSGMEQDEVFRKLGMTESEIEDGSPEDKKDFLDYLFHKKIMAAFNPFTGKINIFAEELTPKRAEESYFHENIHGMLRDIYGDKTQEIAEHYWDITPEEGEYVNKPYIRKNYKDNEEAWSKEMFVTYLAKAMVDGKVEKIYDYLAGEPKDIEILDNILSTIGYDREQETRERSSEAKEGGTEGTTAEEGISLAEVKEESDSRQVRVKSQKGKPSDTNASLMGVHNISEILDNILSTIDYDREQETRERTASTEEGGTEGTTAEEGISLAEIQKEPVSRHIRVKSPKGKPSDTNASLMGVHLALAEHIDDVINESIEVEEHPDYIKDEKGNRAILTELKTKQGSFLVAIKLGKGTDADFDIVSSIFRETRK